MVSALLDELPLLIDEADELMARLCSDKAISTTRSTLASSTEVARKHEDMTTNESRKDLQEAYARQSSASSQPDIQAILNAIDLKIFSRQYLTMLSMSSEKINTHLPSGDIERRVLYTSVSSTYALIKRLYHWQQSAWDVLGRFSADKTSNSFNLLTFDSHPHLTRLVLTTVAQYVKVNLLWTSFTVIPGLLALYNVLHHAQSTEETPSTATLDAVASPREHPDHRVREFVLHFNTAPLLAIQQDFELQVADKGESLAALALSCFKRFSACRDLAKLRDHGVFDLEPLVSGAYAAHACLPDLLHAAAMIDWVSSVVLCVPHSLYLKDSKSASVSPPDSSQSVSPLWDFMKIIARDRLVLTVYRNHVVNLHDLLYQKVMSSLPTTARSGFSSSVPSFKSNRSSNSLKKMMNAMSKFALRNCGVSHRQRRDLARWLVQNCMQLMQHNPGLVAPSFPLFLAALTIARDEIEWVLVHTTNSSLLPKHIKVKHLQRSQSTFLNGERELAVLLTLSYHLQELLQQHAQFLTEYYQPFLLNGDANGIASTIRELVDSKTMSCDDQCLLESFLDREGYRVHPSLPSWDRKWHQANASFVLQTHFPLFDELCAQMECAVRHTEYINANTEMIQQAMPFSRCWWFRAFVFDHCFEQALNTTPSSAVGLKAILTSLTAKRDQRVGSDEQKAQMLHDTDRMQARLMERMEEALVSIVKRDVKLQQDETGAGVHVLSQPAESKSSASTRWLSSFSHAQSSPKQRESHANEQLATRPSSFTDSNDEASDETEYLRLFRALIEYTTQHPDDSSMQQAMIRRVQSTFVRYLRDFVSFSNSDTLSIESVTLRFSIKDARVHTRCFLRATQRLFGCNRVGMKSAVGEAMEKALCMSQADECTATTFRSPQGQTLLEWTGPTSPRRCETDVKLWTLVDRLSWIYVCLVMKKCCPLPSQASAVSRPAALAAVHQRCFVSAAGTSIACDPQEYTSVDAIQQVVGLIGANGKKSICSTIATLVVAQTLRLRSLIEAEHAVLTFMDMVMSTGSNADVSLASAQSRALDDIAIQFILIGTAAFLLQLLHDDEPHQVFDAWDTLVAPALLEELQKDLDRRTTWTRLLPVACSAAFYSSVWKQTSYVSRIEATDTNAHMVGIAIARLLTTSCSKESVHRCAVTALKRTVAHSKRPLSKQLDVGSSSKPVLQALELLVTTVASRSEGRASKELEPSLDGLLPNVQLMLHAGN